jgi:hypothetical protein
MIRATRQQKCLPYGKIYPARPAPGVVWWRHGYHVDPNLGSDARDSFARCPRYRRPDGLHGSRVDASGPGELRGSPRATGRVRRVGLVTPRVESGARSRHAGHGPRGTVDRIAGGTSTGATRRDTGRLKNPVPYIRGSLGKPLYGSSPRPRTIEIESGQRGMKNGTALTVAMANGRGNNRIG